MKEKYCQMFTCVIFKIYFFLWHCFLTFTMSFGTVLVLRKAYSRDRYTYHGCKTWENSNVSNKNFKFVATRISNENKQFFDFSKWDLSVCSRKILQKLTLTSFVPSNNVNSTHARLKYCTTKDKPLLKITSVRLIFHDWTIFQIWFRQPIEYVAAVRGEACPGKLHRQY